MKQYRNTQAVIHLDNLRHNVRWLRQSLGAVFFCPMVKANGYGHGDAEISRCLQAEGVSHFGVGLVEEAWLLRKAGITKEILVFGIFEKNAIEEVVQNHLTPVVGSWDELKMLGDSLPQGHKVHLKFDTGMHRLGLPIGEVRKVREFVDQKKITVGGILTHLHSAEDAGSFEGQSFQQLKKFQEAELAFQDLNPASHTLNSAGALHFIRHQGQALPHGISNRQGVRPGLAVYGVSPLAEAHPLKPAMSIRSQVVRYHLVKSGDSVSYGHTWKCQRDSVVAVVPIGYADGYHRKLSNSGVALFRGRNVFVVGNVCMDYIMLDITDTLKGETVDSLKPEDVTLFGIDQQGRHLSVVDLAQRAGTISWELLTSVGERVPRVVEGVPA